MTLIENRVSECWWLFGLVLPISEEHKDKLKTAFGNDIVKVIPELLTTIQRYCIKDMESFDGYLTFIEQAIDYMRGDSDQLPEVDAPREEYDNMIKSMRKNLGQQQT